jgi:hypothetical protein
LKNIRTNERCYICDFARTVPEGDIQEHTTGTQEISTDSIYRESLLSETTKGRYVFIDPLTSNPICTSCADAAKVTLAWIQSATPEIIVIGVPPDLVDHHHSVDWDNLDRWDDGRIHFPLTRKPKKWALTDEEKAEAEDFLRKKREAHSQGSVP